MPKDLSFIVNGKQRRALTLTVAEPIPDLEQIEVRCDEICAPSLFASPDDYRDGAYHVRESIASAPDPGRYTPRTVFIRYTDGTTGSSALSDHIEIHVPERHRAGEGPAFKAI